jgi:hypothetical protein
MHSLTCAGRFVHCGSCLPSYIRWIVSSTMYPLDRIYHHVYPLDRIHQFYDEEKGNQCKFACHTFWATQFYAMREVLCAGESSTKEEREMDHQKAYVTPCTHTLYTHAPEGVRDTIHSYTIHAYNHKPYTHTPYTYLHAHPLHTAPTAHPIHCTPHPLHTPYTAHHTHCTPHPLHTTPTAHQRYTRSLSLAEHWDATGGKSGATFSKVLY